MHHVLRFILRPFQLQSFALWLLLIFSLAVPAGAMPQVTPLYVFSYTDSGGHFGNGQYPQAALIQGSDGDLYGTTLGGGANGNGAIIKISPLGALIVLHSFAPVTSGDNSDGAGPEASLVQGSDGNFYGTASSGGSSGDGTVFQVTPSGVLTTLASFSGANGMYPDAALVEGVDGDFYGTTYSGGSSGDGTVFKITPSGALTTLVNFSGGNGQNPVAALLQGSDGDFYGTTRAGGSVGDGTVFKMTPSGTLTTLASFSGANGNDCQAALVESADGNFYGTTTTGGTAGNGTVFKLAPSGALTTLYSFSAIVEGENADGAFPVAGLVQGSDGNFYGTTTSGGGAYFGVGTVFKITPSGTLTVLDSFGDADGEPLSGLVLGNDGNLYGTTDTGGEFGAGTIFKITVESQIAHTFSALSSMFPYTNSDGATDGSALLQTAAGSYYGTTEFGGNSGDGIAFKLTPGGLTPLVNFNSGNGGNPQAGLIQGSNGNFYGTTGGVIENGGVSGFGTVFELTPAGVLTTLVTFNDTNGSQPLANLIQGSDGDFYGTTEFGGSADAGTVFKMTPSGALTTLVSFTGGSGADPGQAPVAALVQGSDGNFYGTTFGKDPQFAGDDSVAGTLFRVTPSGVLTTLVSFTGPNGLHPAAALVQDGNGDFYGTTAEGGSTYVSDSQAGDGTVFTITPSGMLTTLVNFDGPNGEYPSASLAQGVDGNVYGTTVYGGATLAVDPLHDGFGTAFKMTPTGVLTTLVNFNDAIGDEPFAGLTLNSNGSFYGATSQGGPGETGTIYQVTGPPQGFGSTHDAAPSTATTFTLAFDDPSGMGIDSVAFPAQPTHGTVALVSGSIAETGVGSGATGTVTVTYTPAAGYDGVDSFTYTVTGYTGTSAPQVATISVGPLPTWTAVAVGAAADGAGMILWGRSDGAIQLWALGANDAETVMGTVYGPFPGWTAKAVAVARDGSARVLWTNANGMAGIWSVNASGSATLVGPSYGPYPGWTATAIGVALDDTSRILWTNTNGEAGLWSFDVDDAKTTIGPTYGPFPGWVAKSVATALDGTSRVLWDNADGRAGIWSFGANDAETLIGPPYGPFAGWMAQSIGAAGDGTSRVLWTNTNGEAGLWSFDVKDVKTLIGPINGPFAGWTAVSLATAATDGTSRVLWDNVSREAGVWSFTASDAESAVGVAYGPY